MDRKFSRKVEEVLEYSKEEAERLRNNELEPEHIFLGILRDKNNNAYEILNIKEIDISQLKKYLDRTLERNEEKDFTPELQLTQQTERIIKFSILEARKFRKNEIETEHLLLAILKEKYNIVSKYLEAQELTYENLSHFLETSDFYEENGFINGADGFTDDEEEEDEMYSASGSGSKKQSKATQTAQPSSDTPVLNNFGVDMTKAAEENRLDPVVGREAEIERVAQILSRRKKNNPILIGEPGVGKSAIVEGLAQRIIEKKVSRLLHNKRVISLDLGLIVAGTKYRGQFEERIKAIINEVSNNKNIILFIDEIHTIIGAGGAGGTLDAANMLKPALARGEIQCIGATTLDEYKKSIEKDGALERRFQKIIVNPTTPEETIQILQNIKSRYEDHHNVTYTDEAIEACVKLTDRYITDRFLPDKAIDALDETGSKVHMSNVVVPQAIKDLEQQIEEANERKVAAVKAQDYELAAMIRDDSTKLIMLLDQEKQKWENDLKEQRQIVDEDMVASVVSLMSGIPVQRIAQNESQRLLNMQKDLESQIIGQDTAVNTLVRAIQRSRVGLKDPNRPIGTFLFLGPTGVGKTLLAKKLAQAMFDSEDALIRVDMSEYMEKHNTSRLIGSPPGYVGYEEGGQLTEKVRRKPYSIILLDEIEKAHPDVFNLLLQIMDEGRITDSFGKTVDFKNTIIIMTSNVGTRQLKEFGGGIGFNVQSDSISKEYADGIVQKALKKTFSPEFLNRVDEIITFDSLSKESIRKIIDLEINAFSKRVEEAGYHLEVSEKIKDEILETGYDIQFGARPLKRKIQKLIEDELASKILKGEVIQGETVLI